MIRNLNFPKIITEKGTGDWQCRFAKLVGALGRKCYKGKKKKKKVWKDLQSTKEEILLSDFPFPHSEASSHKCEIGTGSKVKPNRIKIARGVVAECNGTDFWGSFPTKALQTAHFLTKDCSASCGLSEC